jgi:hypothetical protein
MVDTDANQVWSWDITKPAGPAKWSYFHLYVIIDICSHYVVGRLLADRESGVLAETPRRHDHQAAHRHSGIAWHTPHDVHVHHGHTDAVNAVRAEVLTCSDQPALENLDSYRQGPALGEAPGRKTGFAATGQSCMVIAGQGVAVDGVPVWDIPVQPIPEVIRM